MNDGALTWRLVGLGAAMKVGRALFARFVRPNGVRAALVAIALVAGACGGRRASGGRSIVVPHSANLT
jgi:hypothetical protein